VNDTCPTTVGRSLLAAGHFDNEPDAVLAAIYVLACADALDRQSSAPAPVTRKPGTGRG